MLKVPISFLRRIGIRLVIYLDDILIMNQSKVNCLSDAQKTMTLFQSPGFGMNMDKSVLDPTQEIVFFGIYNQFDNNVHLSTKKEINKHSEVMHRCSRFNISYCKEIVRIDRNFNSFDTSSISSTTPLSVSSNGKKSKTLSGNRIQCRSVSKQRRYKRLKLVNPLFRKMEW